MATASGPTGAARPLGLGAVAWVSMWLATSGDRWLWAAGVLAVAVVALAARRRRSWYLAAVTCLAAVCLGSGAAHVVAQERAPLRALATERAVVVVDLRLDRAARFHPESGTRSAWWWGSGRLESIEGRSQTWRSGARLDIAATGDAARAWGAAALGERLRVAGRLEVPDEPGAAEAVLRVRDPPTWIAGSGPVWRGVERLRGGLREASAPLPADAAALVPALVVGDTSRMSDELRERFRTTGLLHLTAVSGANLTLLLAFLRWAALPLGLRGRWLTAVLVAGVAGFVVLCLAEPSVVRAAAMGVVGLAALGRAGRGRQGLRYLGLAVLLVVLVDPWMARSVGFALSVLASFGLLRWAATWTDALARWMPRWCAEAVAVPVAAQLATEPVVVWLAGQVSVVGVLANALAGPLVGPATVLGLAAAGAAAVWTPLAAPFVALAGVCAQAIAWVARLGDALPGAARPWPATPLTLCLLALFCLLATRVIPWVLARPAWSLGCAVVLVISLARTPSPPGWPPAGWAVAFCDVGQGDATVLNAGRGAGVVIDAGPQAGALTACLDQLGISRVPLVVFTHLHADHVAGATALAGRRPDVLLTGAGDSPASGAAVVTSLGAPRRATAQAGMIWEAGDARVEVLAAPQARVGVPAAEGESSAENDASLLLRAEVGGVSVLLAGDAEEAGQAAHLALGTRLEADVLLVPHHGSSRQQHRFLEAVRASVVVISVGADNDYGHPAARTLRAVTATGALVLRTDLQGSVAVARASGGLRVVHER